MARIIQDDQGSGSSGEGHLTVIQADGQTHIQLPDADFMAKGEILRDGQDLILQSSDGTEVVVENYFSAMPAPVLTTPHGSMLTPELVESFVKTHGDVEYAANTTASDVSAVGLIKEVSGDATITRADGSSEKIVQGMEVHQGDIVETADKGAVNIVFIDESSFSISDNARLAIDEYVFDPSTQAGETNVSILRGMFVFTSGLIGRDDPDDVKIETPVGSIGIRGTTIAGDIQPDGESQITVVEGAIVITNGTGEVTLSDQYQTVTLTGMNDQIQMQGTLDAGQMKDSYGMLGTVNAGFFNTLNEAAPAPEDLAPAPQGPDAPTDTPADANESKAEAEQPVVADANGDAQDANFDTAVTTKSDAKLLASEARADAKAEALADATAKAASATHSEKIAAIIANIKAAYLASLPVDLKLDMHIIDDGAHQGDVVGRAYTTLPFSNAKMSFLNVPVDNISGLPLFILSQVGNGVYDIRLSAAGESYIRETHAFGIIGNISVQVEVGNRVDVERARVVVGDTDHKVAVFEDLRLHDLGNYPSEGSVHGGISMAGGNGYSAAYTGNNNYIVFGNGRNAAGNGDIDGDGNLDHVSGEPTNAGNDGMVFVYSGTGAAPASYTMYDPSYDLNIGHSVAMTDYNGDGYADVFAGAPGFDGFSGAIDVLWGADGKPITGPSPTPFADFKDGASLDALGTEMASLRDFNGDGYGDLAFTSRDGSSWNVNLSWGNASGTAASFATISVPNPSNGDIPIFDMGDINGDGYSDMMIAETGGTGRLLIYYGEQGTPSASPDAIFHVQAGSGREIVGGGSVGDFNGDGYDDIFMATRNGSPGGDGTGGGVDAYIFYGMPQFNGSDQLVGSFDLTPEWAARNSEKVFHMTLDLTQVNGLLGDFTIMATAIGDQNGDGFGDVLLTSSEINNLEGGYYVVNGRAEQSQVNAGTVLTTSPNADSAGDSVVGNAGNNVLSNNNGNGIHINVNFSAGAGNDTINLYGGGSAVTPARGIDGGDGFDVLNLKGSGSLDFRNLSELSSIEKFVFNAPGTQNLTLGLNDIFSLLHTSDDNYDAGLGLGMRYTLRFDTADGTGVDSLTIDTSATTTSTPGAGDVGPALGMCSEGPSTDGFNVYTLGNGYQLMIDANITVTIV